jgi:hypothetical protein
MESYSAELIGVGMQDEIAVASFEAVAALHYAVTGKPLSLFVETGRG